MSSPARRVPRVAADILARMHYGLPEMPGHLEGRARTGYRASLSRMRAIGMITGNVVTEQGYIYLCEAIRRLRNERDLQSTNAHRHKNS